MVRWSLVWALIIVAAGCQSAPFQKSTSEPDPLAPAGNGGGDDEFQAPPPPETGLPLSPDTRFADVPIPQGVKEDLERTYVYESKSLQIGRMVYTSKASVNELAQFYIKEMPASDWNLESVLQADGAELVFTKPDKRARVSIRGQGFGRGRLLVIQLTPVNQ